MPYITNHHTPNTIGNQIFDEETLDGHSLGEWFSLPILLTPEQEDELEQGRIVPEKEIEAEIKYLRAKEAEARKKADILKETKERNKQLKAAAEFAEKRSDEEKLLASISPEARTRIVGEREEAARRENLNEIALLVQDMENDLGIPDANSSPETIEAYNTIKKARAILEEKPSYHELNRDKASHTVHLHEVSVSVAANTQEKMSKVGTLFHAKRAALEEASSNFSFIVNRIIRLVKEGLGFGEKKNLPVEQQPVKLSSNANNWFKANTVKRLHSLLPASASELGSVINSLPINPPIPGAAA